MNNQLQLPWVQPCREIIPTSKARQLIALQKWIQQVSCQITKLDHFAQSLSAAVENPNNSSQQAISRNILR
ncbi:MAG: hypothetical protein A2X25_13905 [Chloroflexi bacterium GWB2_49_20]|nr:MAG: hypothetical protein A2X25_13905 [Chloroflexi bacterium GWB2_49_20]OGN79931.1 MAG: hypothetical protein A2X26_02845 [Chloroflexi bacterium GWC2_49_37]OGN85534.1 MAG: hypothetical protein A2X27_04215 [Chloroflexi bacterium GWD2_49_16]HBG74408.1 hypothetical protein [Anaerolineae bacterium]HCM96982.1 hypothetical protein [Anaerolineae bacterium]